MWALVLLLLFLDDCINMKETLTVTWLRPFLCYNHSGAVIRVFFAVHDRLDLHDTHFEEILSCPSKQNKQHIQYSPFHTKWPMSLSFCWVVQNDSWIEKFWSSLKNCSLSELIESVKAVSESTSDSLSCKLLLSVTSVLKWFYLHSGLYFSSF